MKITFQYHQVHRTEAHEEMIRSHLDTVLQHAPRITKVIVHTELDHVNVAKIRLEAHMPPHKNFSGDVLVKHGVTMEHAFVELVNSFENWLSHKKSKMNDHGHAQGHAICEDLLKDD